VNLATTRYLDQVTTWPCEGRHILAHFDADTIVVYRIGELRTPVERVYVPAEEAIAWRLKLD